MPNQQHSYNNSFFLILTVVTTVLSISCTEPDSPADQLLAEAADLISSAQTAQQASFSEALRLYQAALANAHTAIPHLSTTKGE